MQIRIHYLVFTFVAISIAIFAFMVSTLFERGEIVFTNIQEYSGGPIILEQNPYLGSTTPDIRMIIYSNFTCPNCPTFSASVREALDVRNVVLIWKDLPNDSLNPDSTKASLAAHCAADQGRFWVYHDLLMDQRGDFESGTFSSLASEAGLNVRRFDRCLSSATFQPVIDQALEEASQIGITAAPTLLIGNDRFATGSVSAAALADRLDIILGL